MGQIRGVLTGLVVGMVIIVVIQLHVLHETYVDIARETYRLSTYKAGRSVSSLQTTAMGNTSAETLKEKHLRFISGFQERTGIPTLAPEVMTVLPQPPHDNIMMLKTHKTASSTLQNILMRRGVEKNLTFAIGKIAYRIGYPEEFKKKHLFPLTTDHVNVFCHHARYSDEVQEVMPVGSKYVTILREPLSLFSSLFFYYNIPLALKMNLKGSVALETFATDPVKWTKANSVFGASLRNPMLYDLGLRQHEMGDIDNITRHVQRLDSIFDLVLICEYFDESLILMRDMLHWSTDDIIYIKQNVRAHGSSNTISSEVQKRLRQWNKGDEVLYEYFNMTLWNKAQKYGLGKLRREVEAFRDRLRQWGRECVQDKPVLGRTIRKKEFRPYGKDILVYPLLPWKMTNSTCRHLVKPELPFTDEIVQSMFKRGLFILPSNKDERNRKEYLLLNKIATSTK